MSNIKEYTFQTSGQNCIKFNYSLNEGAGQGPVLSKLLLDVIKQKHNKTFTHCLDWCSGPGFIGFELLDNQVCEQLTLMDFYAPFITNAKTTIKNYNLNARALTCDRISVLSKTNKFDLIVGNPPWANNYKLKNNEIQVITEDTDWNTHKEFFNNVGQYLADNGIIYLFEGKDFSSPDTFNSFITSGGLNITDVIESTEYPKIYILEIKNDY